MSRITQKLIEGLHQGKPVILQDDSASIQRGVLVTPAHEISISTVNRMLEISAGLLFVAMSPRRADAFSLTPMATPRSALSNLSRSHPELNMCVSVEAREGVTTGISAADRARTISILGEEIPAPRKLVKPGHIFPVAVHEGGVLVKHALPEGALDIARIAGSPPAAAFVDLLDARGELMTGDSLYALADSTGIPLVTLSDLVSYRLANEKLVYKVAEARLPTHHAGDLRSCVYRSTLNNAEHFALIKGDIDPVKPTLTRVQGEFTPADVFGGDNPPARKQIHGALRAIGQAGCGVLIYLRGQHEQQLQQQFNSSSSDGQRRPGMTLREYGLGAQILRDLGVTRIELLTSSHKNLSGLDTFGIEIVGERALQLEGLK